jgi:hypothetical protein
MHLAVWANSPNCVRVQEACFPAIGQSAPKYKRTLPDHVHTLIETREGYPLSGILHSWKSYTANKANELLNRTGRFWFPEYFDRYIRDERHLVAALSYIHANPVKAGLVERAEDWLWSSARFKG